MTVRLLGPWVFKAHTPSHPFSPPTLYPMTVMAAAPYLSTGKPLLSFGHSLVHIEHAGDAQLDRVQVTANDGPQPEQASLAGLADLKGNDNT